MVGIQEAPVALAQVSLARLYFTGLLTVLSQVMRLLEAVSKHRADFLQTSQAEILLPARS